MNKKNDTDVKDSSTHNPDGSQVEGGNQGGDKDKNFAELRTAKEKAEADLQAYKAKFGELPSEDDDDALSDPADLIDDEPDSKKDGDGAANGQGDKPSPDANQVAFKRDVREAATQFTQETKVTKAQWAQIKNSVKLTPEMTVSQIKAAIKNVYEALPDVRQAREASIKEEGKKEAMGQLHDTDMDLPGGGNENGNGGGNSQPRIPRETRAWGKSLGLSDSEMADVSDEPVTGADWDVLDPAYKD